MINNRTLHVFALLGLLPGLVMSNTDAAGHDLASQLGASLPSLPMASPSRTLSAVDCADEPGLVIQDDGTLENGYGGNPQQVEEVRFVDFYTPEAYPASLASVCVAFITIDGESTLDIDIVVYDDSGTDGAPGELLGSLPVTVDVDTIETPVPPDQQPQWTAIDLSSLDIEVDSGSVYVGVRYQPPDHNVFIAADESDDRPAGFSGGYWWTNDDEIWGVIESTFSNYRALMVRPVLVTYPEVEVSPASFSLKLEPGQSASDQLTIANTGEGDAELNWSLETASTPADQPGDPSPGLMAMSCEDEPGILIQDDGVVDNGYSGNPASITEARFVDRYTPPGYPAVLNSVCVAFLTIDGEPTAEIEIVVFDDSGSDGGPGQELGSLPVTVNVDEIEVPIPPEQQPLWTAVDLSSLGIEVSSGSLFVGVRMEPQSPNSFIAADEGEDRPVGIAGGYWWTNEDEGWGPIEDEFGNYRALMVRPALMADLKGCDAPEDLGWLSVSPPAGSIAAGDSVEVDVSFDAGGLNDGLYEALLCLNSDDPDRPVIEIPVSMIVGGDDLFRDRFEQ